MFRVIVHLYCEATSGQVFSIWLNLSRKYHSMRIRAIHSTTSSSTDPVPSAAIHAHVHHGWRIMRYLFIFLDLFLSLSILILLLWFKLIFVSSVQEILSRNWAGFPAKPIRFLFLHSSVTTGLCHEVNPLCLHRRFLIADFDDDRPTSLREVIVPTVEQISSSAFFFSSS